MKNLVLTFALCFFAFTVPAIAQDSPKVEGGFGFTSLNSAGLTASGVYATGGYNFFKSIGAEGEIVAGFVNPAGLGNINTQSFLGGPIFHYGDDTRLFGRALFGASRSSSGGVSVVDPSGVVGGGFKLRLSDRIHARIGADYAWEYNGGSLYNGARINIGIGFGK